MKPKHIDSDINTGKFKCNFCGVEEEPPITPAPINIIVDALDYFYEQHKNCQKQPAEENHNEN